MRLTLSRSTPVALALILMLVLPGPGALAQGGEQPGDDLPPEEDTAAYKDCGTPTLAESGSRIIRVVPAGPRRPDGSLAFVPGVCIHLPPGYDTSGLRYPVLYALHGGGGAQGAVGLDHVRDAAALADPADAVISVHPDGSGLAAWFNRFDDANTSVQNLSYAEQGPAYGRTLNEDYVLDWLIPWVDQHLRTIPTRDGRALQGISNGGHGAAMLAAKRPDLFSAVSVLSGNVAWQSFTAHEMFLDPTTGEHSPTYRAGQLPVNLAPNLDHVDLIADVGTSCPAPTVERPLYCRGHWEFEQLFVQGNRDLQLALAQQDRTARLDYRETEGGHNLQWWAPWFAERHLPFLLQRLHDPVASTDAFASTDAVPSSDAPTRFTHRSVAERFSAWGVEVTVDRTVRELLELTVTPEEITVSGSGTATVTTAATHQPGAAHTVTGLAPDPVTVVADEDGRLTLTFDLGPANTSEDPRWTGDTGFAAQPLGSTTGGLHAVRTRTATITPQPTPTAQGSRR